MPQCLISIFSLTVLQVFVFQRRIIRRERAAGTYHVTSAYFANMLAQLPLTLGSTGAFAALVYYFVNLNNGAAQYFTFILVQCMQALVSMSIGFLIATGSPTLQVAQVIGPLINVGDLERRGRKPERENVKLTISLSTLRHPGHLHRLWWLLRQLGHYSCMDRLATMDFNYPLFLRCLDAKRIHGYDV